MTTKKGNPLLIDKVEAARLTALSPRTVDRFVSCGKFPPPLRVGGRRLWNRQALIEWVNDGCKPLEDRP
jgi:predicted DNA-binding transcriptional regulator AlpA